MSFSKYTEQALRDGLASKIAYKEVQEAIQGAASDGLQAHQVMRVTWSFAAQGGAVGTIVLPSVQLPAGAMISRAYANVLTAVTGGSGATLELEVGSSVLDNFSTSLPSAGAVVLNSGNPLLPSGNSVPLSVSLVVGVAALTAGEMVIYLEYVL